MNTELEGLEHAAQRDAGARAVLADALEARGSVARAAALRGFVPPPALRPVSLRLTRSSMEPPLETPGYRKYSEELVPTLAVVGDFGIATRPAILEDRSGIEVSGSIDKVIRGVGVSLSGDRGRAQSLADLEHAAPSVRASWRAAAWLGRMTGGVRLVLFTADKKELRADLEAASSVRRSGLYTWIRPMNHPGMRPFFGALVLPELSPIDDLPLAERIAAVAAELAIPIVLSLDGTPIAELGAGWEALRRAPGARFLAVGATPFRIEGEPVASGVALAAGVADTWRGDATVGALLSPVPAMGFRPASFSEAVEASASGVSLLGRTHQPLAAVALASGPEASTPLTWVLSWSRLHLELERLHLECAGLELGGETSGDGARVGAREVAALMHRTLLARLGEDGPGVHLDDVAWLHPSWPQQARLGFDDGIALTLRVELPLADGGSVVVQGRTSVGR